MLKILVTVKHVYRDVLEIPSQSGNTATSYCDDVPVNNLYSITETVYISSRK